MHVLVCRLSNSDNSCITSDIRTSCRQKRELYSIYRNSNNLQLKRHYQVYCKILSNVIKEAKRIYYDKKIKKSNNKGKTTWDIINPYRTNVENRVSS